MTENYGTMEELSDIFGKKRMTKKELSKMFAKKCGRVIWVEDIIEAPDNAYIARELNDGSVRLERYEKGVTYVIRDFQIGSFKKKYLHETIKECRKEMGNRCWLYVEIPAWTYAPYEPLNDYEEM